MTFSWLIFLLVLGLGIVLLALWTVFGQIVPFRRSKSLRPQRRNVKRLRRFSRRLFELVTSVSEDVDRYQAQIEQVNEGLAAVQPREGDELAEFVLKSVAQIMQINERLQSRLNAAETKLQEQRKQIEAQLAEARTDPLTGLPNRRAFDDELNRRVAEWQRKNNTFCLMMIDIDHFKALNDQHGHPAGDYALRNLAEVLDNTLREMDLIARIGGEEFAAVLPSTGLVDGCRAAERTRTAVASHCFRFEETDLRLTVSLGLAAVDSGENPVSLMKRADEALYAAKRAGRNCGYLHNGQACKRIDLSCARAADDSHLAEDAELVAIGDDLRDRLAEVAGGVIESQTGPDRR